MNIIKKIANLTKIDERIVSVVLNLLEDGKTIPFIARYRKEKTNGLDENELRKIQDQNTHWENFIDRKNTIIDKLKELEVFDSEISEKIEKAAELKELEDIYLPYKKKRKTKADKAVELGLKPVAEIMKKALYRDESKLRKYKNEKLKSVKDVIDNTLYIIAEEIANSTEIRDLIRETLQKYGFLIASKKKNAKDDTKKYKDYYKFRAPLNKVKSYQVFALFRAEKEKVISFKIDAKFYPLKQIAYKMNYHKSNPYYNELFSAIEDSLKRLILPSLRNEIRSELFAQAEDRSIKIFSENLRHLLLTPPLEKQPILGIDPGFRTGCKCAVVDSQGNFKENAVIYLFQDYHKNEKIIKEFIQRYKIKTIAIGNGTASKETSELIGKIIQNNKLDSKFLIISESGASVYSASKIAQKEFPKLDLTVRSAITIAKRVLSPLDEYLKVPSDSIGVGMYQHDVSKKKLREKLDREVESVVNHLGVDINKASEHLLKHISGLSRASKKIIKYREENGIFKNRKELKKVSGIGKKTFELAAGFTRIPESENPLDNTIIHPEDYRLIERIAHSWGLLPLSDNWSDFLTKLDGEDISILTENFNLSKIKAEFIMESLLKRKVDPRSKLPQPLRREGMNSFEELRAHTTLQGTIKNVLDFGAFVDLGTKVDGLIHISTLNGKHPLEKFYIGQIVNVLITKIDRERKRISLEVV